MDELDKLSTPLSMREILDLKITIVTQETKNEMMQLFNQKMLVDGLIMDAMIMTCNNMIEGLEEQKSIFDQLNEKIDTAMQSQNQLIEIFMSEKWDKVMRQLKAYRKIEAAKKADAKRKRIEWFKQEIAKFNALEEVKVLEAKKKKVKAARKILQEKKEKVRQLAELEKQQIINLVKEWKKSCLAEEQKILEAKKAKEEKNKKYVYKPLEKMDMSFSVSAFMNVKVSSGTWTVNDSKQGRRSFEKAPKERENRRHSSETAKRRHFDEPSDKENDSMTKRVRFSMNASYRSPTPEDRQPVPGPSKMRTQSHVNAPKNKSPIKSAHVTDVQKPVFKIPKVPPVKGILKKSKMTVQNVLGESSKEQAPALLRRTKSQVFSRKILTQLNEPREEHPKHTLNQFSSEIVMSNVVAANTRSKLLLQPAMLKAKPSKARSPVVSSSTRTRDKQCKPETRNQGPIATTNAVDAREKNPVPAVVAKSPQQSKAKGSPDGQSSQTRSTPVANKENVAKPVKEIKLKSPDSDTDEGSDDSNDGVHDDSKAEKNESTSFLADNNADSNSSFHFNSNTSQDLGFGNFFGSTQDDGGLGFFGTTSQSDAKAPDGASGFFGAIPNANRDDSNEIPDFLRK